MKNIKFINFFLLLIFQYSSLHAFNLKTHNFTEDSNSTIIVNVQIYDGKGSPPFLGSVRIKNSMIIAVGNIKPNKNEHIINGKGLVLAPGFIDAHSHHYGLLKNNPASIATASQGITTIVIGQDGDGYLMDTLIDFMNSHHVSVNVATYTGHSTLREMVMGENNVERQATQTEIEGMKKILMSELQKGSLGLSTGLEYEAAFYSSKDEVLQLTSILKNGNGRYISHIRSEDNAMDEAIDEIIDIGKINKIPVQISHLKIAKKDNWGKAKKVIQKLEKAQQEGVEITADIYPYNFWNSTPRVLFPDKKFTSMESATFAVNQLFDAENSYLVQYAPNPAYKDKTIAEIARLRKESIPQTLINLIEIASIFKKNNPDYTGTIQALAARSMSDNDVADFIKWKSSVICSDGSGGGHPRGYGSFTKVLSKYVREEKIISLTTAIHKMTGLTAQFLGIKNRGIIAPNYYADLVLFNPKTVKDNATIHNSRALSSGINLVWVNGKIVYNNLKSTNEFSGELILR